VFEIRLEFTPFCQLPISDETFLEISLFCFMLSTHTKPALNILFLTLENSVM